MQLSTVVGAACMGWGAVCALAGCHEPAARSGLGDQAGRAESAHVWDYRKYASLFPGRFGECLFEFPWAPLAAGCQLSFGDVVFVAPDAKLTLRWQLTDFAPQFRGLLESKGRISSSSCEWSKGPGDAVYQHVRDRQFFILQPDLRVISVYAQSPAGRISCEVSGEVLQCSSAARERIKELLGGGFCRSIDLSRQAGLQTQDLYYWTPLVKAGIVNDHEVPDLFLNWDLNKAPNGNTVTSAFRGAIEFVAPANKGAEIERVKLWLIIDSTLVEGLPVTMDRTLREQYKAEKILYSDGANK